MNKIIRFSILIILVFGHGFPCSIGALDFSAGTYGSLADLYKVDENAGLTAYPVLRVPMGGKAEGMGTAFTAVANDLGPDLVFAQQVYGYGKPGDTLFALSTSGNSGNVINALRVARALDMRTIGFTGEAGGSMLPLCDCLVKAPSAITPVIQEYHLVLYHLLCSMLEAECF